MASKTLRLVPGLGLVVETTTGATELYPGGLYTQPSASGTPCPQLAAQLYSRSQMILG